VIPAAAVITEAGDYAPEDRQLLASACEALHHLDLAVQGWIVACGDL
jgi:hypothetical protein